MLLSYILYLELFHRPGLLFVCANSYIMNNRSPSSSMKLCHMLFKVTMTTMNNPVQAE